MYYSRYLGVTILLSLTVFLNMVAETMPATSDAVPLLGKMILFTNLSGVHAYSIYMYYLSSLSLSYYIHTYIYISYRNRCVYVFDFAFKFVCSSVHSF